MKDFAKSENPAVQAQLDRLAKLSLPEGRLGLETMRATMERLGNPHRKLPPTFHVAGTNGKGSVCAFLRAMLEAQGYSVHVTTSPHLVRYNERIRLAGQLIEDAALAALLAEVLDACEDLAPSFFEVTIAASFLAFSRTPADACVIEVGLGGRFDATNVIEADVVAACGIAALGIDHERFLLTPEHGVPTEPMARIAFEKAGIAKGGVPLVTLGYDIAPTKAVIDQAMVAGARPAIRNLDWFAQVGETIAYRDANGSLDLPIASLPGAHQAENAALAAAILRHQDVVTVSPDAIAAGIRKASWPARLQRLSPGPLVGARNIWLDGGHNRNAGEMLAQHFAEQRLHLVIGLQSNRPADALTGPLAENLASITVVPVPGHDCHPSEALGPDAKAADNIEEALLGIPSDDYPILIAGSLYLAGEVLRLNDEIPD